MRQTYPGFVIPEYLQAEWCDTIFGGGVEFLADMVDADSYEWQIGLDTTTFTGRSLKLTFNSYKNDTFSNLDPFNPDYYLPLTITLTVKNDLNNNCITTEDTLMTFTKSLVFSRKSLIAGEFQVTTDNDNSLREVNLLQHGTDTTESNLLWRYYAYQIGLPFDDTITFYPISISGVDKLVSYKQYIMDVNWDEWSQNSDGVIVWRQKVTPRPNAPDKIDLYFEKFQEGTNELVKVNFTGERIE